VAQVKGDATLVDEPVDAASPRAAEGFRLTLGHKILLSLVATGIVYLLIVAALGSITTR
jgi:hypothetical protein